MTEADHIARFATEANKRLRYEFTTYDDITVRDISDSGDDNIKIMAIYRDKKNDQIFKSSKYVPTMTVETLVMRISRAVENALFEIRENVSHYALERKRNAKRNP